MAAEKIEVWLGYGASREQGEVVEGAFAAEGIPVDLRFENAYPPVGNGAGFTILVGLIGMSLGGFVSSYFSAAGNDAWEVTKSLMQKLKEDHHRRYPSEPATAEGLVTFKDVKHRRQLNIRTDLPDEAYAKLADIAFDAREDVAYHWDGEAKRWVIIDLSDIEDLSARTKHDPDVQ